MEPEWFKDWFDSPYYHILYKYRDEAEAEGFIDKLLGTLHPRPAARIMDLACGKGRYSIHLADKGFEVTGLDLSEHNITYARQFERDNLSFYTHDMRMPFRTNYFDFIFNFFTSFGYFDQEKEDLRTLKSVATGLRPDGLFVLDFFNSRYVIDRLIGSETKEIDGITFQIQKHLNGQYVKKAINFEAEGRRLFYEEKVRLFTLDDFERLFRMAGLKIIRTYGDYQLHPFDTATSPRLILLAQHAS